MDKKHSGARNELIACAWLLQQGYEVYRNVSQHGDVDIMATKDGEVFRFDVKGAFIVKPGNKFYGTKMEARKIEMGLKHLYVFADGCCEIEWEPTSDVAFSGTCEKCDTPFKAKFRTKRFCSAACASTASVQRLRARRQSQVTAS